VDVKDKTNLTTIFLHLTVTAVYFNFNVYPFISPTVDTYVWKEFRADSNLRLSLLEEVKVMGYIAPPPNPFNS